MTSASTDQYSFGSLLRRYREKKGLTQARLAERIGWSESMVRLVELGRRRAGMDFALACDKALSTGGVLADHVGEEMNRRSLVAAVAASPLAWDGLRHPAVAENALAYGLRLSDRGDRDQANTWFRISMELADWIGEPETSGYVRARAAVRGLYDGWSRSRVIGVIHDAQRISGNARVMSEVNAAWTQLCVQGNDLHTGRQYARQMVDTAETDQQLVRAAAFVNYVEGSLGTPQTADDAFDRAAILRRTEKLLYAEARIYRALAHARAGDSSAIAEAVAAARSIPKPTHMISVAADCVVQVAPTTWDIEELVAISRAA